MEAGRNVNILGYVIVIIILGFHDIFLILRFLGSLKRILTLL